MKSLFPLIITSLFLLSSPARAAVDPATIQLYHAALQKMERPFKSDDFRPAELDSAEDYDDLAQIYIEAGDYAKALETTMKALEIDQFDPIANLNAGLINYELEDYDEAAYYLRWA
ncbi:MAG: tetratricopeptide repeat protein, partial [Candidatus Brocadiales bacterium]